MDGDVAAFTHGHFGRVLPIEQIPVGKRNGTRNPIRADFDFSLPEPNQETWSLIRLEANRSDGGVVDIELLRPNDLIRKMAIVVSGSIPYEVEELEINSWAKVISIEPSPQIADGVGSVITARFQTRRVDEVTTVTLEDGSKLTGTTVHPIWSVNANAWVGLSELGEGDLVQGRNGNHRVTNIESQAWCRPVYNIEVHGEHRPVK